MTSTRLEQATEPLGLGEWNVQIPGDDQTLTLDITSINHERIEGFITIESVRYALDVNVVLGDTVLFRPKGYSEVNPMLYLFIGSRSQGAGKVLYPALTGRARTGRARTAIPQEDAGLEGSWTASPKPNEE